MHVLNSNVFGMIFEMGSKHTNQIKYYITPIFFFFTMKTHSNHRTDFIVSKFKLNITLYHYGNQGIKIWHI